MFKFLEIYDKRRKPSGFSDASSDANHQGILPHKLDRPYTMEALIAQSSSSDNIICLGHTEVFRSNHIVQQRVDQPSLLQVEEIHHNIEGAKL